MKRLWGIQTILIKAALKQNASLYGLMDQISGGKKILVEPGLAVYQLPDSTTVELYGVGACYPSYLFAYGDIVIGYRVHDIMQVVDQLTLQGGKLLGEVVTICSSSCYCFMLMEGNQVIGLYQLSSP